jgi:hypothetical protein
VEYAVGEKIAMNYEQILQDIIHVYSKNCVEKINTDDAIEILQSLLSMRDTAEVIESTPRHLLQVIFENNKFNNKCVYPCDVIQLRAILAEQKLTAQSKIVLFTKACSERVIRDQKLRLIINCDPQKLCKLQDVSCRSYGGICVINDNVLDIENLIECIVVESNEFNQVQTVEQIVKDMDLGIAVYTKSFVPGIEKYKFASSENTRYVVNLSLLGNKE